MATVGDGEAPAAPPSGGAYVVTAHKPTAVHRAFTAAFTRPDATNLLIAKVTHIELYEVRGWNAWKEWRAAWEEKDMSRQGRRERERESITVVTSFKTTSRVVVA